MSSLKQEFRTGRIIATEQAEVSRHTCQDILQSLQTACSFLDPDNIWYFCKAGHCVRQHVTGGTAGHVIQDLGNIDCFSDQFMV